MFRRIMYVAAVIAVTACGSATDSVSPPPPPPPPPTPLTVQIMVPSAIGIDGKVTVSASVSPSTPSGDKIAWKLGSQPIGQGVLITFTLNPGDNLVCVDVTGASGEVCKTLTYTPSTPKTACKVVVANPTSENLTETLHITLTKGDQSASRDVGPDGDCSLELPFRLSGAADTARFVLTGTSGVPQTVHPMIGYVSGADFAKGIVLIAEPMSYHNANGPYPDSTVAIVLSKAYVCGTDKLCFFTRTLDHNGAYVYAVIGLSDLPFTTLVQNKPESLTASQLAALSTSIDSIRKFGLNIAQAPVTVDTLVTSLHGTLAIIKDSTKKPVGTNEAAGTLRDVENSVAVGAAITFYDDGSFTTTVILHELLHTIGFGHGCGWSSVMNLYCNWKDPLFPNSRQASTLTAADVAYVSIMLRTAALQKKYNTHFSLAESHQGERVLELGLTEEKVSHPQ